MTRTISIKCGENVTPDGDENKHNITNIVQYYYH